MNLPTTIAVIFLISAFVFVVGIIIYRRFQGTVEVNFEDRLYCLGDKINGTVTIKAKVPLALSKTKVSLECIELLNTSTSGGRSYSVIFEDGDIHSNAIYLKPRQRIDIPFSFNLPKSQPSGEKLQSALHIKRPRVKHSNLSDHISSYHRMRFRWIISVNAQAKSTVMKGGKAIRVKGYTLENKHEAYQKLKRQIWE